MGYLNPFSGTDPIIPDMSVAASLPIAHKNVQTLTIPANEIGHILMYPGLDSGIMFMTGTGEATSSAFLGSPNDSPWVLYGNAYHNIRPSVLFNTEPTTAENFGGATLLAESDVVKWRLVSQGMRLSLLNTETQNDGYWESVRMNVAQSNENFGVLLPTGSANVATSGVDRVMTSVSGTKTYTVATPDLLDRVNEASTSLPEFDGYTAAPLKMIGAAMWQLLPFAPGHDFNEVTEACTIQSGQMAAYAKQPHGTAWSTVSMAVESPTTKDYFLLPEVGSTGGKDLLAENIDHNHDCCYVRIHAGTSDAKLLLTHCANHEVVYATGTTLHKHMKPHPNEKMFIRDAVHKKMPAVAVK